jgi:hypothetical protein
MFIKYVIYKPKIIVFSSSLVNKQLLIGVAMLKAPKRDKKGLSNVYLKKSIINPFSIVQ